MGVALGLKPEKIEMTPFGFFIEFEPDTQKKYKQLAITNILVAIAGPITNLIIILGILFLHISFLGRDIIVYINLVILIFNLIPIYPLDGGRVLKGILELFYNRIKTDNLINKISNLYMITLTMIGSIAIYYFKNISILMILFYLWILVIKENKKILIKNKSWELAKKSLK